MADAQRRPPITALRGGVWLISFTFHLPLSARFSESLRHWIGRCGAPDYSVQTWLAAPAQLQRRGN